MHIIQATTEYKNIEQVDFTVYKKDYAKIEKQSNISIGVSDYENKTPYCSYTLKQTHGKHVQQPGYSSDPSLARYSHGLY